MSDDKCEIDSRRGRSTKITRETWTAGLLVALSGWAIITGLVCWLKPESVGGCVFVMFLLGIAGAVHIIRS